MAFNKFRQTVHKGIRYYKENGAKAFTVHCLEKLRISGGATHKIKIRINPLVNKNVFIPKENFNNEFEAWEKALQTDCRIAVQCHVFYVDLFAELKGKLSGIPYSYDLYITTDTDEKAQYIRENLDDSIKARCVDIETMPNEGRDVIPFLKQMRPVFVDYDYICHLHTKKTKHNEFGEIWRRASYETLLGSAGQIRQLFGLFQQDKKIGLIFPHIIEYVPCIVIDWSFERPEAEILWKRMQFKGILPQQIIFPAGSMMWLRTEAVRQLLMLLINSDEIPPEEGQTSGTIIHAIERLWVYVAEENGYDFRQVGSSKES